MSGRDEVSSRVLTSRGQPTRGVPPGRRGPSTAWRVVAGVGGTLIAAGVLILLFTAYLLWGTGLSEASHQSTLREQLCRQLHSAAACGTSRSSATTTTTTPTSGVQPAVPGLVPAEGQPVGIVQIPKIGVNKVVVEGTGEGDLRLGPGHYPGTPLPGEPGNASIAGHRTTYGAPFYNLNELAPGDQVIVTTGQGRFLYRVTQSLVVDPSDVSVIAPTPTPELTLTTCNPRFSAAQRLVVHAGLTTPPAPVPLSTRHLRAGSTGLAGSQGAWAGVAAWGAGCVAWALAVWLVARRLRQRRVAYAIGTVPMLVLLFFLFENVAPLFPASF